MVYKFVFEPAIVRSQVLMALRAMVQRFKTKRVIQQTANLHQVILYKLFAEVVRLFTLNCLFNSIIVCGLSMIT